MTGMTVTASALSPSPQIYNETVRDLLNPGKALDIREGEHGTVVPGLTHYECRSADEVIQLLHMGNQRRAEGGGGGSCSAQQGVVTC